MTFKTTPALLDRLNNALGLQGLSLKRSQLLEVAAAAFGFRSSNAMTAAAKAGELALSPVQPEARVSLSNGETLMIVRDPSAGAPYAIDESFLEQVVDDSRAEQAGITPYGHLVDLNPCLDWEGETIHANLLDDHVENVDIHVAIISHKGGHTSYAAFSEQDLYLQMHEYVSENWHEVANWAELGEHPDHMSPEEAVDAYFDLCNDHGVEEYLEMSSEVARLPMRLPSPTPAVELIKLAEAIEEGASADIWYDAHQYGSDDPDDSDRIAENVIESTQAAMQKAASLLRAIAAGGKTLPAKPNIRGPLETAPQHEDFLITDQLGNYQWSDESLNPKERGYAGFGKVLNAGGTYPAKLGVTADSKGKHYVVPSIEFSWGSSASTDTSDALVKAHSYAEHLEPLLAKLQGTWEVVEHAFDNAHQMLIFIPMEIAFTAPHPDDWFAALSYLLKTQDEKEAGPQVTCEFTAQMDVRKYIVSVDPLGDTAWDGTFDALRWGRDAAKEVFHVDPDEFARSVMAPQWIQDWPGPFVVDPIGLDDLFDLYKN